MDKLHVTDKYNSIQFDMEINIKKSNIDLIDKNKNLPEKHKRQEKSVDPFLKEDHKK